MIARKMAPEEYWQIDLVAKVAFEGAFDLEKAKREAPETKRDPLEDQWGAFSEDGPDGGKLPVAGMNINHYDVCFDGHTVKLGGIGGVSTLPACRRGGAVRALMTEGLKDLYGRGHVFSALYPFSTAFYRKFGFENGALCLLRQVPLEHLPREESGGRVYQLFPGDDLSPLLEVYRRMYGACNLADVRDEYDRDLREKNLLEQKRYIFVWEDDAGRPGAFLIGSRDGDVLNCRTDFGLRNGLLFRDAEAFTAMLSFVRGAFLSNFRSIRFGLPAYPDVSSLIPEVTVQGQSFYNGMVRTVNARRALELCRCRGNGAVTVEVRDPLLPENDGVYRLAFSEGRENLVEQGGAEPDVILGPGELAQLLCGVKTAEDLPWMPGAAVCRQEAALGQVFYRKRCQITDLF